MPRKQKTIHYIYKTTCNVTKRYYIGMHSTSNLDDGYMGSGTRLRRSIRKYGEENHIKEILEFFENREELVKREIELVTKELICDDLCMNLMCGGEGGFISDEQQRHRSICGGNAFAKRLANDKEFAKKHGEMAGLRFKEYHKNYIHNYKTFLGKSHSEETKKLMSEIKKGKYSGEANSQHGTCWITNGVENKKIKKDGEIPEGWYRGREKNK